MDDVNLFCDNHNNNKEKQCENIRQRLVIIRDYHIEHGCGQDEVDRAIIDMSKSFEDLAKND